MRAFDCRRLHSLYSGNKETELILSRSVPLVSHNTLALRRGCIGFCKREHPAQLCRMKKRCLKRDEIGMFGITMKNKNCMTIVYIVTVVLLAVYSIGRLLELLPSMIAVPIAAAIAFILVLWKDPHSAMKRKILAGISVGVFLCMAMIASI